MSQALTPESVLIEFLRNLGEFVQANEPVVLVLRGSLLLRRWFGEKARPPAGHRPGMFRADTGNKR